MLIHRIPTPLVWPATSLPLHAIARDWTGLPVEPPVRFAVAVDPERLWFVAARAAPAVLRPDATPGAFTAGLWHWDVAELFLGHRDHDAYLELNLAPDGAWWACEFVARRARRSAAGAPVPGARTWADATAPGGWRSALSVPVAMVRDRVGFDGGSCAHTAFVLRDGGCERFVTSSEPLPGPPDFHAAALRRAVVFAGVAG